MDTTTVNFTINKISEAAEKLYCKAAPFGTEYVKYTISKIVIGEVICGIIFLASAILVIKGCLEGTRDDWNGREKAYPVYLTIGVVLGLFSFILGVMDLPDMIAAIQHPNGYAVQLMLKGW